MLTLSTNPTLIRTVSVSLPTRTYLSAQRAVGIGDIRGKQVGYIDMLAVLPEYTGHKLGKWLTVFLLHYFKAQRVSSVMLDTDDFRLPAIKNYLNLGFVPAYVRENHVLRWRNIFQKLELL